MLCSMISSKNDNQSFFFSYWKRIGLCCDFISFIFLVRFGIRDVLELIMLRSVSGLAGGIGGFGFLYMRGVGCL